MAKIKLLIIVTLSEMGGAQKYVYSLATGLPKDQFEVKVICAPGGPLISELTKAGIEVTSLQTLVREINPKQDWQAIQDLKALIHQWQPDIVHVNSTKVGLLGRVAAWFCKVPVSLYTAHGFVLSEPLSKSTKTLYWLGEKLGAWLGTYTIAVSEVDRQLALRYKLTTPSRIITIHNGIELEPDTSRDTARYEETAALKAELNLPTDKLLIGTIANFYPTKGLSFFLKAGALIKQAQSADAASRRGRTWSGPPQPRVHLVLIGDGEERPQLLELVKELGLSEDVTFLGRRPNAGQLTSIFDLFIISSIKEGLPFALLEAMAQECAVVATRVGGIPEVLGNNEFGLLVEPGDASALADAAVRLLQNPALARQLGKKARSRILTAFSSEEMLNQTSAIYSRLLSESKTA
ncbi:MAG: glycosyltransferase family 4 protein [Chloroflexota bacterium]